MYLPPLPVPYGTAHGSMDGKPVARDGFTSEQMHAYAIAARALYETKVATLEKRVAELQEKLNDRTV